MSERDKSDETMCLCSLQTPKTKDRQPKKKVPLTHTLSLSLSLCLMHTHTHTHTQSLTHTLLTWAKLYFTQHEPSGVKVQLYFDEPSYAIWNRNEHITSIFHNCVSHVEEKHWFLQIATNMLKCFQLC